jgi:hypothetical protein
MLVDIILLYYPNIVLVLSLHDTISKSNGRPQTATLAEYQCSIVIKIRY